MDRSYCCVPQCRSKGSDIPRPSFHRFPSVKEKRLRDEWIRILKIGKKISKRMVVCGSHFQTTDFFPQRPQLQPQKRKCLKKNAVPSLLLPVLPTFNADIVNKKKEDSLRRHERKEKRERERHSKTKYDRNLQKEKEQNSEKENIVSEASLQMEYQDECTDVSKEAENVAAQALLEMFGQDEQPTEQPTESENIAAEALIEMLNDSMNKDVATQVTSGDLLTSRTFLSKISACGLKSLTGLHSFALLDTLTELLEDDYKKNLGRHCMNIREQIILTLMRLKMDLSFAALSVFFECSPNTVKNIFRNNIFLLEKHLKNAVSWLSKEAVLSRMPRCFKGFEKTRVVVDCTEIEVSKTNCSKCNIMTYSQYKNHHTIKFMIGISPAGLITFISPIYGGRASDKQIFQQSNIIHFLQPHEDAVMADKGFYIDDVCKENFIDVIRPPFLRQKAQFSRIETEATAKIARARVHVERMIQRLKIFKIFSNKIPWNILPYMKSICTVCAGLANLGPPILSDDKF